MKPREDALIRLFHVYKRYGAHNALFDISLDIFTNEFLFLAGPSGAGKSTLLKLLYLGETLSEGQILFDRMNLARVSSKRIPELRRKLGIIFQDFKLIPTKTVYENVALVLEARGMSHKYVQKKVNNVLRTVGMEDRKKSFPPGLSGGEQQKVAVARAVVGDPKIILADEPTGSLDADSAEAILNMLINIHAHGATVLVATHDQELIRTAKGRVILLKEGKLVA
jgi:cell division transport system ATP-binding protein